VRVEKGSACQWLYGSEFSIRILRGRLKMSLSLKLLTVGISLAAVGATISVANADVTYTYTGVNFTEFNGTFPSGHPNAYTPSDLVTGSFTVPIALAPSTSYSAIPAVYSFSDGLQTFTPSNSSVVTFDLTTNPLGNIVNWLVNIISNSCTGFPPGSNCFIVTQTASATVNPGNDSAAFSTGTYLSYTTGPNGSWGPPTVGTTPLPAALPLFATGLGALGLLGWRRKRKARSMAVRSDFVQINSNQSHPV
jgi:hypothetical protein